VIPRRAKNAREYFNIDRAVVDEDVITNDLGPLSTAVTAGCRRRGGDRTAAAVLL